jgi:hypothetical protein
MDVALTDHKISLRAYMEFRMPMPVMTLVPFMIASPSRILTSIG